MSEKRPHAIVFKNASKTKQSFKKECDINKIMTSYDKTGVLTHTNNRQPRYGDFSDVQEYNQALNFVMDAQQQFFQLPSNVRAQFENDPGKFLIFCNNPENADKLVELGLAKPSVVVLPPEQPEPSEAPKKEGLLNKVLPNRDNNSDNAETK